MAQIRDVPNRKKSVATLFSIPNSLLFSASLCASSSAFGGSTLPSPQELAVLTVTPSTKAFRNPACGGVVMTQLGDRLPRLRLGANMHAPEKGKSVERRRRKANRSKGAFL
jgi:hypothetical protein